MPHKGTTTIRTNVTFPPAAFGCHNTRRITPRCFIRRELDRSKQTPRAQSKTFLPKVFKDLVRPHETLMKSFLLRFLRFPVASVQDLFFVFHHDAVSYTHTHEHKHTQKHIHTCTYALNPLFSIDSSHVRTSELWHLAIYSNRRAWFHQTKRIVKTQTTHSPYQQCSSPQRENRYLLRMLCAMPKSQRIHNPAIGVAFVRMASNIWDVLRRLISSALRTGSNGSKEHSCGIQRLQSCSTIPFLVGTSRDIPDGLLSALRVFCRNTPAATWADRPAQPFRGSHYACPAPLQPYSPA